MTKRVAFGATLFGGDLIFSIHPINLYARLTFAVAGFRQNVRSFNSLASHE